MGISGQFVLRRQQGQVTLILHDEIIGEHLLAGQVGGGGQVVRREEALVQPPVLQVAVHVDTDHRLVVDACIRSRAGIPQEQLLHGDPAFPFRILRNLGIGYLFDRFGIDQRITVHDPGDPDLFVEFQRRIHRTGIGRDIGGIGIPVTVHDPEILLGGLVLPEILSGGQALQRIFVQDGSVQDIRPERFTSRRKRGRNVRGERACRHEQSQ